MINFNSRNSIIIVFALLFFALALYFPKIYLRNNIYYVSKDINRLYAHYISLQEENTFLSQQLEDMKLKNQIIDSFVFPPSAFSFNFCKGLNNNESIIWVLNFISSNCWDKKVVSSCKDINRLYAHYISLQEENTFLSQQLEDMKFKNQIIDSLLFNPLQKLNENALGGNTNDKNADWVLS